jgi:hypothetical protein
MEKKFFTVIQHGYFPFGKGESVDEALRNSAENLEMTPEEVLQAFYGDEDGNYPTDSSWYGREVKIRDARPPRRMDEIGAMYLAECTERFFRADIIGSSDAFTINDGLVDLDTED